MTARTPTVRLLLLAVAAALLAGACTSGGSLDDLRRQSRGGEGTGGPIDVQAPEPADPNRTGRVGLIIATNSETWREMIGSADDEGVTVLFVQPGGPAEGSGIEVGDVITSINGEPSLNAERAVVQLRAPPGDERVLDVARPDGAEAEIHISPEIPGDVDLTQYYTPLVEQEPTNPLYRFLRAQAGGPFDQAMADVEAAIDAEPSFVEAISLRAELRWNKARQDQSVPEEQAAEMEDEAMSDWNLAVRLDPLNTRVLVSRSQALSQLGNAGSARRDAQKARAEDATFPGAHYAYALSEFVLEREATAAPAASRAVELNPYDVRYYQLLARIFANAGECQKAEDTVDAIIGLVDDQATRDLLRRVTEDC